MQLYKTFFLLLLLKEKGNKGAVKLAQGQGPPNPASCRSPDFSQDTCKEVFDP